MTNWNKYFLKMCEATASNSKCLSRQIGAIIVKDKSVVSTGYNGAPRGVIPCDYRYSRESETGDYYDKNFVMELISRRGMDVYEKFEMDCVKPPCPRAALGFKSGEGLEWCVAGHAERNAIVNAARLGVSVKGATMYMNCPIPCKDCLIEIINAGIKEIVVTKFEFYDKMSPYLVREVGLIVKSFNDCVLPLSTICERTGL